MRLALMVDAQEGRTLGAGVGEGVGSSGGFGVWVGVGSGDGDGWVITLAPPTASGVTADEAPGSIAPYGISIPRQQRIEDLGDHLR
jgi:hypothetical protein